MAMEGQTMSIASGGQQGSKVLRNMATEQYSEGGLLQSWAVTQLIRTEDNIHKCSGVHAVQAGSELIRAEEVERVWPQLMCCAVPYAWCSILEAEDSRYLLVTPSFATLSWAMTDIRGSLLRGSALYQPKGAIQHDMYYCFILDTLRILTESRLLPKHRSVWDKENPAEHVEVAGSKCKAEDSKASRWIQVIWTSAFNAIDGLRSGAPRHTILSKNINITTLSKASNASPTPKVPQGYTTNQEFCLG
ncbi:hypothetical protein GGX14DRAFT_386976 [Mycena pura]|uniref:Uncharacterized protein n=1 Tax=Mycena pura TaxID=153505 RepID=A0AAD6YMU0_9AGAR|nr:hypothetical protein GGX14DRAFT_386976 [Mycena pura]